MPLGAIILFLVCALLFLGIAYMLWRHADERWRSSADDRAFDRRVARLNQRQSNRISDEQLTQPVSDDDAWHTLIQRGQQGRRRRERYAGDLERRRRERKRERE